MKALCFDTETTDLLGNSLMDDKHQPFIIEFYGAVVDGSGAVIRDLDFLADPGFLITPETTRITGITRDDLKGQPPFKSKVDDVISLFEEADVIVGHNLTFDLGMVGVEMRRAGAFDRWWESVEGKRHLCTVEATEFMNGYRLSLSNLHLQLFGEPFAGAHRARVDVEALIRCFNELRNRNEVKC